ncbi:MAG TPA: hypothetical protein VMW24_05835 [Sedimentisphaerales bacterium]|nr:hypothetical protein [Sedimentisphaerales bacterium]
MGKKATTSEAAIAKPPVKPQVAMTATGLMPTNIDDGYRFAQMVARSRIVPANYQNQPDNCLVAIDLSLRWGVSWLVVMQHVYMVHDRPALDASLCIALTNKSGIFVDPIEYEVVGDDARKDDYKVRAYAVRKSTGKTLYGPWIDWLLVKGEGWDKEKKGFPSKWMTMPDQMFHYRAAVWFQRRYAPEVAMGMITVDEAEDTPIRVESKDVTPGVAGLKERIAQREGGGNIEDSEKDDGPSDSDTKPADNERSAERQARKRRWSSSTIKIDELKAALAEAEEADEQSEDNEDPSATEVKTAEPVGSNIFG